MSTDIQLELDLPEGPLVAPEYTPAMTNTEKFAAFHEANPHVARALEALAEKWMQHQDRCSIDLLFQQLRWHSGIRTTGDVYELNNTYRSFYVRLLIDRRPEWETAFRLRRQTAA